MATKTFTVQFTVVCEEQTKQLFEEVLIETLLNEFPNEKANYCNLSITEIK